MQHYKVKLFYFPKSNNKIESLKIDEFKKNNTVLKLKHIKTAGYEEKIIKAFYIPKEKKDSQNPTNDHPMF